MHPGVAYARRGAIGGALAGGLGLGAIGAAASGLPKTQTNWATGKKETLTKKQRISNAITGGLVSGGLGAYYGGQIGWNHRAHKWNTGFRPGASVFGGKPKAPDWLKGAKTKAEGRKMFHQMARKHHPDLGGDPEVFKRISQEWETHEPFFKEAMYAAFADEIEKIASLGALVGGYAGHRLSPKTQKGQLYGILGGALVGHLAGKGVGAAKREFVDDLKAREAQSLYGYIPYAGQQEPAPSNFY